MRSTADTAARKKKQTRSALVRDAVQAHRRKLQIHALEDRERAAYSRQPAAEDESVIWEGEAAWPAE